MCKPISAPGALISVTGGPKAALHVAVLLSL